MDSAASRVNKEVEWYGELAALPIERPRTIRLIIMSCITEEPPGGFYGVQTFHVSSRTYWNEPTQSRSAEAAWPTCERVANPPDPPCAL